MHGHMVHAAVLQATEAACLDIHANKRDQAAAGLPSDALP